MPPKATVSARAPLPFVPIETQRITRSAALRCKANDPAGNSKIPLGINCICGHNFINPSDTLMLCEKCSFWSHKKCVGLATMSVHEVTKMKFMCPFCSGELVKRHRTAESVTSSRKSERHPEGLIGGADDSRSLPSVSASRTTITRVKLEEVPDKNPQPSVTSLARATLCLLIADLEANTDVLLECIPPLLPTTMLPEYPAEGEGVIVGNISVVSPLQSSDAGEKLSIRGGASAISNIASAGGPGRRRINLSSAVNRNATTQCTDTRSFHLQSTLTSPSPSSTSAANAISASTSACSAHSSGAARSGFSNDPRESSRERASVAIAAAALNSLSPDDLAPHENPFYPKKFYNTLTDSMILECLDCCKSAIANATFSESYPDYCLRELQAFPHKYLQGTFARCKRSKKVIAFILTNGMDEYGNLKSSLSQLRQTNNKALAANGGITSAPNSSPTSPNTLNVFSFPSLNGGVGQPTVLVGGAGTTVPNTTFTEECLRITDINDFVHITLVATHEDHRGRGLAKKLMLADSLRWLIRGRTRAYLNMALERVKVPIGARASNSSAAVHPTHIASASQTDDIDGLAPYSSEDALTEDTLLLGVKRSRDGTPIDELSEVTKPNAVIDVSGGHAHPGDGSSGNGRASESEEEYDVVCVASESSRRLYTSLGFVDVVPSKIDPGTNEIKWTPKEEEGGKVMANLDMKESARTVSRHIFGDTAPLYSGRKVLKLKK